MILLETVLLFALKQRAISTDGRQQNRILSLRRKFWLRLVAHLRCSHFNVQNISLYREHQKFSEYIKQINLQKNIQPGDGAQ